VTGPAAGPNDADVPVPIWAVGLLAAGLATGLARRRRG